RRSDERAAAVASSRAASIRGGVDREGPSFPDRGSRREPARARRPRPHRLADAPSPPSYPSGLEGAGPASSARSAAAVGDDEVGRDADEEPEGEQAESQLAVAVAPHGGPDLADHVEDRSAGDGIEGELEGLRGHVVADHGADEGGAAPDQAREGEPAPGRPHGPEGPDDPEALGGVVEGEADDQHRRQADLAGAGGDPDRKALGEVV